MIKSTDKTPYDFSSGYPMEMMDKLIFVGLTADNDTLSNINQTIHNTLMCQISEEILMKVDVLLKKTANYPHVHTQQVMDLLLQRLKRFATKKTIGFTIPFHSILYHLDLAHKLERIDWEDHNIQVFSPVDELLIYLNYNSKAYIKMLEAWLSENIRAGNGPKEQLQHINFYRKAFAQLHRKPDVSLHKDYLRLTDVIDNWFLHEMEYLQNELEMWIKIQEANISNTKPEQKVEWTLSGDQIALLLRAADDTRIIHVKSRAALFKKVVPHIRTPFKETLSPEATRTSAYHAEQADKDKVLEVLEKMKTLIRGY